MEEFEGRRKGTLTAGEWCKSVNSSKRVIEKMIPNDVTVFAFKAQISLPIIGVPHSGSNGLPKTMLVETSH